MRVCDLTSSITQIQRATKRLEERWSETRELWNDAVSRQFQEKYLDPIIPELRIAFAATHELAELFQKGERCCRDPERSA